MHYLSSIFRHFKGNFDMRHGAKIIDFVRSNFTHNLDKICRISKVAIMKEELDGAQRVSITVDVLNSVGIE